MIFSRVSCGLAVFCLGASLLQAQTAPEVEALKQQLKEATNNFERVSREQRQEIDASQ